MKKMANGGLVQDDEELKNTLTPGTSDQIAPVQDNNSDLTPKLDLSDIKFPEPSPTLLAGLSTDQLLGKSRDNNGISASLPDKSNAPHPVVSQPAPQSTSGLPGMPPGIGANDLAPYIQQQKAQIQKFGPQQQVDLENKLISDRNSLGYRTTDALKGFGDALMMGVAGTGNPGWQEQFEKNQMEQGKERLGVEQEAHKQNLEDLDKSMSLDAKNPSSTLSKSMVKSMSATLTHAGIPSNLLPYISGEMASQIATHQISLVDALARIKEEATFHRAEIGAREQGMRQNALEGASKMGLYDRNFGQPDVYKALLNAGSALGNSSPAPHGQSVKQNGKLYTWNGASYEEQ